ncbi:STAS/SEC14 domain-containing protein, partial [Rubrivirga sp.]|uniref:STAS/SEC14 domain-containing protein n=1 Tax=Rubrivirga sp. TaxID=1885344 RepID=UPI003C74762F
MFHPLDLGRPDVFAYRVTDILTDDDVRQATDAFDAVLEDHDTVHLYAEVEGLRGADVRAIWLDLVYGLRYLRTLRHIGRVALVTDAPWIARLARLEARLLPLGEIRTCEPGARADAREWVRSAPADAETPSALEDLDSWYDAGGLDAAWSNTSWFDGYVPRSDDRPRATARFGHTVHRTHVMLNDVAGRLEVEGTAPAYRALRAVLPALRD